MHIRSVVFGCIIFKWYFGCPYFCFIRFSRDFRCFGTAQRNPSFHNSVIFIGSFSVDFGSSIGKATKHNDSRVNTIEMNSKVKQSGNRENYDHLFELRL